MVEQHIWLSRTGDCVLVDNHFDPMFNDLSEQTTVNSFTTIWRREKGPTPELCNLSWAYRDVIVV